jgi:hypothetical protein
MDQSPDSMFEERINSCPNLQYAVSKFKKALNGLPDEKDLLIREALVEFASGCGLAESINYELDKCAHGQQDVWPGKEFIFILYQSADFLLEVRMLSPQGEMGGQRLISAAADQYYTPISNSITMRRFLQPEPFPEDQIDPAKTLRDLGLMHLNPGDVFALTAGYDLFEITGVEHQTPILILHLPSYLRYHWIYDPASLSPELIMSSDQSTARIQFALRILAALPSPQSIPIIESLMEHGDHFIRWEAVRQAFSVDESLGRRLLSRALTDPNAEVRNAASLTALEYV